jgi:hypothetical protein
MPMTFAPCMADALLVDLTRGKIQSANPRLAMERLRPRLLRARRYVIDDEVAVAASLLATRNPEVLAQLLPSARAPHPAVWLEWDQGAQALGTGFSGPADNGPGVRIGAFVEQVAGKLSQYRIDLVLRDSFQTSDGWQQTFVLPPFGSLHDTDRPLPLSAHVDEEDLAAGLASTRAALATSLLGTSYVGSLIGLAQGDPEFYDVVPDAGGWREHRLKIDRAGRVILSEAAKLRLDITDEELDARQRVCDHLTSHASLVLHELGRSSWDAGRGMSPQARSARAATHELLSMYSGFWGFIIALLAMIANPELVASSDPRTAGTKRFVSGKNLPFLEHRMLTLRLTRAATVERTVRAMVKRLSPRRHEVSGHWNTSQRRGDPTCDHAWLPLTDTRQSCALCEGLRWWVAAHSRGDIERGYVSKDRRVAL